MCQVKSLQTLKVKTMKKFSGNLTSNQVKMTSYLWESRQGNMGWYFFPTAVYISYYFSTFLYLIIWDSWSKQHKLAPSSITVNNHHAKLRGDSISRGTPQDASLHQLRGNCRKIFTGRCSATKGLINDSFVSPGIFRTSCLCKGPLQKILTYFQYV